MNRLILIASFSAALAAAHAGSMNYDPYTPDPAPVLGGGWTYDQVWGANIDSDSSSYVFTLGAPAVFRITDAYMAGDNFTVYDGPMLIMSTSGANMWSLDYTGDPDLASVDPNFSHGSVPLGIGAHSLTVQSDLATWMSPAGFFTRLDAQGIPDGGGLGALTGCIWAALLVAGGLWKKSA